VDNNVACEVDDLHVERNIVNVVGSIYIIIWYDMIWYDMIWYDMIWHDMTWHDEDGNPEKKEEKKLYQFYFAAVVDEN
jgi:hypothetical protein